MTAKLSVNLNAVAMLRNRRNLPWPSITGMGRLALNAGASGLTVHPRPDQRHIRFSDLADIRALIDNEFPQAEFNIEGFPTEQFLILVEKYEPEQVTLVPDDPMQDTSDHGWDFETKVDFLVPIVARLKKHTIRVSLFSDPNPQGLEIIKALGAERVEFFTGLYGAAHDRPKTADEELYNLKEVAEEAIALGLGVNAGHDLTIENLPALVQYIPALSEVSIGHGLIADALCHGMQATVKRFLTALQTDK